MASNNLAGNNLPNLDETVLSALDFFTLNKLPHLKFKNTTRFVVGSVNAYNTGRMLFGHQAAIFADEGTFQEMLETYRPLIKNGTIKEAIIISASGEKDSIWEIKAAKKAGLKTHLLTCSPNSTSVKLANESTTFKKIPEPYSYNFSTYLGMLLSVTSEDPKVIKKFLLRLKIPKNFKNFSFFSFILPNKFKSIVDMIMVKDDELFGPYSSLRSYNEGTARHAKFIVRSPHELVISFIPNKYFGEPKNRWNIKTPQGANFAFILSLSYYLVGLIQKQKPAYFKNGLRDYCLKTGPKPYGKNKPFPIIVK